MALILGAAVPSIRGIIREQQALEPLNQLAEMVRATRDRAIRLQRPYQIGFDAAGCFASAFRPPYEGAQTFEELQAEIEAHRQELEVARASAARFDLEEGDATTGGPAKAPAEPDDGDFLLRYEWPPGYEVSVRFWQDPQWETLEAARSRIWVIQPTGLTTPLLVRITADGVSADASFDPLTGELSDLHSSVR